jgi:hypothetical protein
MNVLARAPNERRPTISANPEIVAFTLTLNGLCDYQGKAPKTRIEPKLLILIGGQGRNRTADASFFRASYRIGQVVWNQRM